MARRLAARGRGRIDSSGWLCNCCSAEPDLHARWLSAPFVLTRHCLLTLSMAGNIGRFPQGCCLRSGTSKRAPGIETVSLKCCALTRGLLPVLAVQTSPRGEVRGQAAPATVLGTVGGAAHSYLSVSQSCHWTGLASNGEDVLARPPPPVSKKDRPSRLAPSVGNVGSGI